MDVKRVQVVQPVYRTAMAKEGQRERRMAKKPKKPKRDACYKKVKERYTRNGGTWPSAYASGALVQCRKVGAANWGNKSKKNGK